MKISLITVCYNAEKTIADAMASVAGQKGVEIEYIVVDGGSADGTVDIIKKFEREGLGQRSRSTMEGFSFKWVSEKARMKYLPICTTVMRMGGASTNGWRTTLKINRSDLRALKANGCWSCLPLLYSRYFVKIWGFMMRTS